MRLVVLLLTVVAAAVSTWRAGFGVPVSWSPAHVRSSFAFDVRASRDVVVPLFGAHRERAWAEGWEPQFLFPQPAEDRPGEVFTVTRGGHSSVWVNTALDLEAGHIQYVYVVPDLMAVSIDIHATASGAAVTHVEVAYERTSLSAAADDHVKQLGEADQGSAEHWRKSIEDCLQKEGKVR